MRIPDSVLVRWSLAVSFIGLIGLAWLSTSIELPESQLSEARCRVGETVRVEAVVEDVTTSGNVTILSLREECSLEAVAFERLDVGVGDRVEASGTVERYEGEPELLLERLSRLEGR
ncbi:MAG: hypothetical protein ACLFO2_02295 [Candidatus Woesearchaeota archaeon]